jgi:two-component system LytT family response regulator/two-component system response regulator LytT
MRKPRGVEDAGAAEPGTAPLRAVVVDDEQLARDELRYQLGQLGGVDVIAEADNGVEAVALIGRGRPDLVFLDVQMPGLTGFEVARRLIDSGSASHIIFVTAFDRHAIEAFEVNAVDYLLKPIEPARLETALDRVRRRVSLERQVQLAGGGGRQSDVVADRLEAIVQLVAARQDRRQRLAIKVGERFLLVDAAEIVHASMAAETITIVTTQLSGTSSYRTLDELQARLDPSVFWRVHRSHLVNINKIKEIVPWFSRNYILRMKDHKATEIPVSRTQTRRLREYLKL